MSLLFILVGIAFHAGAEFFHVPAFGRHIIKYGLLAVGFQGPDHLAFEAITA